MGRRKKIVEQCERLMDHPGQIRNIAIAAHIDHGKCIAGEARVVLADGRVMAARDLFSSIESDGVAVEDREGAAYRPEADDLAVVSLDRSRGETTVCPVEYAVRRRAEEPLVSITTSNGHSLATTPEHRFLVLTPAGVMEFARADSLDEGDIVVGARNTPIEPRGDDRVALLRRLAADSGCSVSVSERFTNRVARTRAQVPAASGTELSQPSLDNAVERGPYRLVDLITMCESLGIDLLDLYAAIDTLNYRGESPHGSHSSLAMALPEDLTPLYYLAGVFFGAGTVDEVVPNTEPELKAALDHVAAEIGLDVREPPDCGDCVAVGGKTLLAVLRDGFAYGMGETSQSIHVPELVFTAPRASAAAFVRGYLDADGTVDQDRSAVSVTALSDRTLRELQLLLYRFDVASAVDRSNSTLEISGALSLHQFAELIGFAIPEKQDQLERLVANAQSAPVDQVPVAGGKLREIREDIGAAQADLFPSYRNYETDEDGLSKRSLARITDRFADLDGSGDIRIDRLASLANADTSFVAVDSIDRVDRDYVYDFGVDEHHNFVAEGLIVHNTTLTDNLLAGAGMISKDLAGQQLAMDTEEDEQERGITIDAANVSMTHSYNDTDYLINLIDTPGHVDFGGDVTRAMRAVDGALVVVDAVEGTMPQTETVLRQALREDVKPALFINKVDRLINELREGPEEMQERLQAVIRDVNELIRGIAPERFEEDNWRVTVQDGTVAFGSALYNWAISLPFMQETGIDFGDIYEYNQNEDIEELRDRSPLSNVVLNMVAEHFPDPLEAQPRRIPSIWRGDADSELAEQMRLVEDDGEVVLMVTDISLDPHAGEIATGRLFSGTIERGQDLFVSGVAGTNRIQSVGIFMGGEREEVERVPAGNIAAVTGLNDAIAGSTVSSVEMTPFESIEHISEPVITKSIEAQSMDDLPKLIEVLQQVSKEDPTIHIEINEDTGEHLISGQGELHLEVITQRIERNQGIPVRTGEPIVVYRETPREASREVEGVSPNRHNRFYMTVEPLPEGVVEAIKLGDVSMDMPEQDRREALQDAGLDKETSQNVETMVGANIVIDDTKGIQHLNETMELVLEGFEDALREGPLAREPVQGALVRLVDARLHEDAIHRGPAQVIPAVRESLHRALIDANVALLEPMQDVRIDVPSEHMGAASGEIQGRRGRVDDMYQEGDRMVIEGVAPVEEMIGFSSDIRSATEGRASWNTENAGFEVLADNLQDDVIMEIRERKGLKLELPAGVDYF